MKAISTLFFMFALASTGCVTTSSMSVEGSLPSAHTVNFASADSAAALTPNLKARLQMEVKQQW